MTPESRLLVAAIASIAAHFGLERALEHLPRRPDVVVPEKVEIRVESRPPAEPAKEPEPEPAKPKPPEPKPPEPKPVVHEQPRPRVAAPPPAAVPHQTPPDTTTPATTDTTDTPAFGVTMESTSSAGSFAVPVGNTTHAQPTATPTAAAPKPLAAPIAAYEATTMPLPQGRCSGKYTDDARAAGDEGVVVLDLTVGADGRTRDVQVVSGLPHGLTEAAVAALRDCRFSPGAKDGQPVAVHLRGFKIRFVLDEP